MAAVGQLAAGIAHDFNNVMAVIVLASQMLQKSPHLSEQDSRYLAMIRDRADHATQLIGQILDFGRRSYMERVPLDLLSLVKETTQAAWSAPCRRTSAWSWPMTATST